MELAFQGTKLYTSSAKAGPYQSLYGLSSVPDFSGEPEKVEVTNIEDVNKRYIPGVIDFGDPEFEFLYNKEDTRDVDSASKLMESYRKLRASELSKTPMWYKLIYPDGTGFLWQAYVTTTRSGGGNTDPLKFKAKMLICSAIDDVPGIDELAFSCVAGALSGATKISTVSPTLTSGNSYVYVVGLDPKLPAAGEYVTGASYTLGNDIVAAANQTVLLVEVNASWQAVKAGKSIAVPKA